MWGPIEPSPKSKRHLCFSILSHLVHFLFPSDIFTFAGTSCTFAGSSSSCCRHIWPSGRPGSARPGHGPGTARWCRAGTARRAPRAVPYRASCPVDSPSTAPQAEIRAVPPAQPGQNLRAVPTHNPKCRKPLIIFLINSTFIILTSHSQNHKNNLTI